MKNALIIAGIVALGVVLFGWNRFFGDGVVAANWEDTDIRCIAGHTNLAFHFHPHVQILVNGQPETIPANTGITPLCMAEVHTHDTTGTLHIEGLDQRDFHLSDFFTVWDKSLQREGYTLTATLNGQPLENPADLKLEDKQQIILNYQSAQ
jgi:hypothetical protein